MHHPIDRKRIAAFPHLEAEDAPPSMVEALSPDSGGGRYPVKRVIDEPLQVEADVFADADAVEVFLRWRRQGAVQWEETPMILRGDFRYVARIAISEAGAWEYAVCVSLPGGASVMADPPETLVVEAPLSRSGVWAGLTLRPFGGRAFRDCLPRMDALKMMGFDILALPELTPAQDSMADFDWLVRVARQRGLELAVTLPVVMGEFHGSGWRTVWDAWRDEIRLWMSRGIRVLRFAAAHNAPPGFWGKLIASARSEYPEAVFLAETDGASSKLQLALARAGFSQMRVPLDGSESKAELKKSIFELGRPELRDHFRASLWPEFPDTWTSLTVLKTRIALAAALSSSWGIDDRWLFGEDGYASLALFVTQINHIRRAHAALRDPVHPVVCHCPNRNVLCLLKAVAGNAVLIVLNLGAEEGEFEASIRYPRATSYDNFIVRDLFTGEARPWHGVECAVTLDAGARAVRVFRVEK